MSVELSREGWIELFTQMRRPNAFLSRMFTVKPGGQYNGDKVAIDIERIGEDVAIAIQKCTGPNLNDISQFTTKEFTPPSYGEAFPIDACDLLNRMAGVDPYSAAYTEYSSQLVAMMAKGFVTIGDKISRAIELQASQILQTGKLTLINSDGSTVYTLDFKPKATHFPTTSNSWSGGSADPLGDLEALAKVVRADGQINPDRLIMGEGALRNFLNNSDVKANLDNRRMEIGEIAPEFEDSGATFYGHVWVGNYKFEIWSYPDTYKHPQTGAPTEYIGSDKVVMTSSRTRFDMATAKVPLLVQPDQRVAGLIPDRIQSRAASFDVTPNVYVTPNGKQIMGEIESRTILIPVQIDGYACLDTEV